MEWFPLLSGGLVTDEARWFEDRGCDGTLAFIGFDVIGDRPEGEFPMKTNLEE